MSYEAYIRKANHRPHNGITNQGYAVHNIKLNAFRETVLTCFGALVERNLLGHEANKQQNNQQQTAIK